MSFAIQLSKCSRLLTVTSSIIFIGLVGLSPTVSAQDGQTAKYLEEIVVTARKRDERLQETPVSVTVFTARDVEEAGIEHPTDFIGLTPNVHIADTQDPSNVAIQIRGIGQIRNGEAPAAVVVDGVIVPSALSLDQDLLDVKQIEVLKGPQGALYGRNAIAGAINITTQDPTNEFVGKAVIGSGNGGYWRYAGTVSGPLAEDKLMFRIAGSHRESDGLINNPSINDEVDFIDETAVQSRLKWLPADNLTVDARFAYNSNQGGSGFFALASVNNGAPGQTQITNIDQQANIIVPPRGNFLGFTDKEGFDYAVKADWKLESGTLTSISSYSDLHQIAAFPGPDYSDGTQCTSFSIPFFTVADCPDPGFFGGEFIKNYQEYDLQTFSQEIRFTSPSENQFRYISGAYYLNTERDLDTVNNFSVGQSFETEIILDPAAANRTRDAFLESNSNDAYAVFGQMNYDISDKLELSLSVRYDKDERNQTDPRPDVLRTDGNGVSIDAGVPRNRSASFDAFQPKVTAKYVASENLSVYATYAEGFRSGGFNAPGSEAIADNIYQSEESENYEVGFKSQWAGRRVTLNGAFFYSDVANLQVFNFFPAVGLQLVTGLDEVEVVGGELELSVHMHEGLEVYAAIGIADTEIQKSDSNPAAIGNEVPYTTKFSANAGVQYRAALSDDMDGRFRLDWEHKGETPFHEGGHFSGLPMRDPVNLINARASLVMAQGWNVTIWGKNLTDEEYWGETVVADYAYQAPPRTYGIELSKKFN